MFPALRLSSPRAFAAALIALAMLAGCGRGKGPEVTDAEIEAVVGPLPSRQYCPEVNIRRQTNAFPVYQRGFDFDPQRLRYQGTIDRAVRECAYLDGQLVMRIGVSGRILRGPGDGETINAEFPVRVVVTGGRARAAGSLFSGLQTVRVTLVAGAASAPFSVVQENVVIPLSDDINPRALVVQTGFDREADGT